MTRMGTEELTKLIIKIKKIFGLNDKQIRDLSKRDFRILLDKVRSVKNKFKAGVVQGEEL